MEERNRKEKVRKKQKKNPGRIQWRGKKRVYEERNRKEKVRKKTKKTGRIQWRGKKGFIKKEIGRRK